MIDLFIQAAFVENLALTFFLGICTLLGGSRRVDTALGLGAAVLVVLAVTIPANHILYERLLRDGAWAWAGMPELDLSHLSLICFIGLTAATVQILEMALDRFFPTLFRALGIFLPLITVNCAILGGSLFMVDRHYDLAQSAVFALGSGVGWALAVATLAAIRERIQDTSQADDAGSRARVFVVIGILSMAFLAFSGVRLR